jgi:homoserine O-acetyltransferase
MVRAQVALLDLLGIERLHAVVGGSMGGMQALSLAAHWPGKVDRVMVIAATAAMPAQNIAFQEVGRQATADDPNWQGGNYYGAGAVRMRVAGGAHGAHHASACTKSSGGACRPGEQDLGFDADSRWKVIYGIGGIFWAVDAAHTCISPRQ